MSTIARLPNPEARARTFRALARERHAAAVDCLLAGDDEGWRAYRKDADAWEDKAREQEELIGRIRRQQRERAQVVRELDGLIRLVRADVESA